MRALRRRRHITHRSRYSVRPRNHALVLVRTRYQQESARRKSKQGDGDCETDPAPHLLLSFPRIDRKQPITARCGQKLGKSQSTAHRPRVTERAHLRAPWAPPGWTRTTNPPVNGPINLSNFRRRVWQPALEAANLDRPPIYEDGLTVSIRRRSWVSRPDSSDFTSSSQ